MHMKDLFKSFALVFLTLVLIAGVVSMVNWKKEVKPDQIGVGKLVEEINAGQVKSVSISGDVLSITLKDEKANKQEAKKEPAESFGSILENYGVTAEAKKTLEVLVKEESSLKFWAMNLLPIILPLLIIIAFFLGLIELAFKRKSFFQEIMKSDKA